MSKIRKQITQRCSRNLLEERKRSKVKKKGKYGNGGVDMTRTRHGGRGELGQEKRKLPRGVYYKGGIEYSRALRGCQKMKDAASHGVNCATESILLIIFHFHQYLLAATIFAMAVFIKLFFNKNRFLNKLKNVNFLQYIKFSEKQGSTNYFLLMNHFCLKYSENITFLPIIEMNNFDFSRSFYFKVRR